MISVAEARARIVGAMRLQPMESVTLDQACGRALAEDARAAFDQPPFPVSAMDGYAVRSGDAGPRRVIGTAPAGHPFDGTVGTGEAVRIFTGGVVPEGADAIVIQENARREGDIACDEILFERLRELRKKLADERGVPAYVVFGDTTLRALARAYPTRLSELGGITGIGEKKRAEFGEAFTEAIVTYLETNPRMQFD